MITSSLTATPSLSIIIPVYNEPRWISRAVEDLVTAVERSPFRDVELIVVDDGSDAPTRDAVVDLQPPFPYRVIRQRNLGRFTARRVGVEAATRDLVLLLDSRISIDPDALRFVAREMTRTGPRPVWNGHVEHLLEGNPYGRFWCAIESLAFRDYLSNPRTTSYGLEEFDRYPKGTTCFLAPRNELRAAIGAFHSYYDDERNANDDTPIIRALAGHQPINISPGFSCLYRPRDRFWPFVRHAFHRGGVFVDGYGRPGTRFYRLIVTFFPVSAAAAIYAVRRPRRGLVGLLLGPVVGLTTGAALRRSRTETLALGLVGPIWVIAFAGGMWRGLALALRARRRGAARTTQSGVGR